MLSCPNCHRPLRERVLVDRELGYQNFTLACDGCHHEYTSNLRDARIDPQWRLAHPESA